MAKDLEGRVVELETRVTLQQDLLEQLSDVLYAQQRELDTLVRRDFVGGRRFPWTGVEGPKTIF